MRSLSIAIGLCWFSFAAFGQTGFGSLSGSVYQGDHAPLANIPVEAKNVATGTFYKTTTSPQGDYKFERLPAGKYEVSVLMLLYRPFLRKDFAIATGGSETLNVQLYKHRKREVARFRAGFQDRRLLSRQVLRCSCQT